MRVQNDYFWVIGCPERNTYMRWKGDHISGTYTDTVSVEDAETHESRALANSRTATDPDVIQYLENRKGLGFRVCRVNRRTYVV